MPCSTMSEPGFTEPRLIGFFKDYEEKDKVL